MSNKNDGGPAVQIENILRRVLDEQNEKSLRDWFAGNATDDDVRFQIEIHHDADRAKMRYAHADDMIRVRQLNKESYQ